jgi:hypothetical protein
LSKLVERHGVTGTKEFRVNWRTPRISGASPRCSLLSAPARTVRVLALRNSQELSIFTTVRNDNRRTHSSARIDRSQACASR